MKKVFFFLICILGKHISVMDGEEGGLSFVSAVGLCTFFGQKKNKCTCTLCVFDCSGKLPNIIYLYIYLLIYLIVFFIYLYISTYCLNAFITIFLFFTSKYLFYLTSQKCNFERYLVWAHEIVSTWQRYGAFSSLIFDSH